MRITPEAHSCMLPSRLSQQSRDLLVLATAHGVVRPLLHRLGVVTRPPVRRRSRHPNREPGRSAEQRPPAP